MNWIEAFILSGERLSREIGIIQPEAQFDPVKLQQQTRCKAGFSASMW
jgi:hypothetical protein